MLSKGGSHFLTLTHPSPPLSGLWVSTEEAKETEEDILVMLSKGVAYACAEGTEPLVKRLYQQVRKGGE